MKRVLLFLLLTCSSTAFAQDVSLDKKLGAENALAVEQEIGLYHHDSLYQLINSVGQKLVSRLKTNPFEFKFFLADSEEPNAFALPGGYIYVTRGILPMIQTEDELAGIIAHEIIHVMQRHSVKQMKKGMVTGLLKVPGNVINKVTGTGLGNILNAPIEFSTKAFISKYSRGHEAEADKFGIQLAASAGYKTDALADALERLAKEIELLSGEKERHSYFSDHPYTPSRITSIRSSAPGFKPVKPSPLYASRETFLRKFNGLCVGPNPEQGLFDDSLFIHPDMKFSWFIPSGWQAANKPAVVTAYTEKGDAIVTLRITDNKKSPKELGEEAKGNASKVEGVTIEFAGDTLINALPAYLLRMMSRDKNEVAKVELIWVNFEGNVFQLAGVAIPGQAHLMHESLVSFRKSTSGELNRVSIYELQFVQAENGETIKQLSARTENQLDLALTAVINNVSLETALKDETWIKIVRVQHYKRIH